MLAHRIQEAEAGKIRRALVRSSVAFLIAAVGLYHLQILAFRLADGSVLEPLVAGRWVGSAGLILLLVYFRRRGISLLRGREALALWLLVALVHGGASPVPGSPEQAPLPAEVLWLTAPLGLAVTAFFWAGAVSFRRTAGQPVLGIGWFGCGANSGTDWRVPDSSAAAPRAPPA